MLGEDPAVGLRRLQLGGPNCGRRIPRSPPIAQLRSQRFQWPLSGDKQPSALRYSRSEPPRCLASVLTKIAYIVPRPGRGEV